MANRRLTTGVPIWVRVPGIIALVLVGVLVSTMLVGAARIGGGAGPGRHAPVQPSQNQQEPAPGGGADHRPPGGGH